RASGGPAPWCGRGRGGLHPRDGGLAVRAMARLLNREPRPTTLNALSVDVEEYYHAHVFQKATNGKAGVSRESRVEASVERVLTLLGPHAVKAPFSVRAHVASHPRGP